MLFSIRSWKLWHLASSQISPYLSFFSKMKIKMAYPSQFSFFKFFNFFFKAAPIACGSYWVQYDILMETISGP